jgi:hypothetical protein
MTWGRTLENALKSKGISKDLDEWIAIACTDRLFPKMGECREVLGGGPAPPSKL